LGDGERQRKRCGEGTKFHWVIPFGCSRQM
jgi:hypothetical protein